MSANFNPPPSTSSKKARQPARQRFERGRSPHPGVVIVAPKLDPKTRRPSEGCRYRLRIDADLGPAAEWNGAIPVEQNRSVESREAYAQLAFDALRLKLGLRPGQSIIRGHTLMAGKDGAIALYQAEKARLSKETQYNVARGLARFEAWFLSTGLTYIEDLRADHLAAFRKYLNTGRNELTGQLRRASTVNQYMKDVRALLNWLSGESKLPHLTREQVRGALKRIEATDEEDINTRALSVAEVRAILQLALKLDAEPLRKRSVQMAPYIALALLTGMRRSELRSLVAGDFSQVDDLVNLRISKTGPRPVEIDGYSVLLRTLLGRMVRGRAASDELFPVGDKGLGYAWTRLRAAGVAEDVSIKTLRSTCATFQDALKDTGPSSRAARLGHSLLVAERYYFSHGVRIKRRAAPTLEHAMECADLIRMVIAAYEWKPMRKDGGK